MLQEKLLKAYKKINFQNFKELNFKKYSKIFSAFLILIIIGLFLPRGFAHAGLWELVAGGIYGLVYLIFWLLFYVAWLIAWIGAWVLNVNLNPAIINDVFANPAIYQGWTIIRDICNLLFLLIMLLVAFGTIVQSNKYNIKNSLTKLILAIFLINFSNVIAGAIIDFGNILMYGILSWMCPSSNTCFQDLMKGLMQVVNDFHTQYNIGNVGLDAFGAQQAVGMAVATIYTFMYGFILLAMAFFLIVRTAGLAILLILSPFAYFGEVMPGMEKIASKWWNNIWSYTLFGPIFALMLYISGLLAQKTITAPVITDPDLAVWGTLITTIISNSIPLLFLLAIIPVTKELGLAGTDTILKNTTGLRDGIVRYAGGATDRWLARGAQDQRQGIRGSLNRARAYLSPTVWKKAYKAHTAEQEYDYDIAAGAARGRLARGVKQWEKPSIDYKQEAVDRAVSRKIKDLSTENVGELSNMFASAVKNRDHILMEAILRKLSSSGDTDAALGVMGYDKSRKGFSQLMNDHFKKTIGEERSSILASDVSEGEAKNGNVSFQDMGYYDRVAKKWKLRDISVGGSPDEVAQRHESVEKFKAKSAHEKFKGLSALSMTSTDAAGDIDMTNAGIEMIATLKAEDWNHVKKMKRKQAEKMQTALRRYQATGLMMAGSPEENFLNQLNTDFGP